MSIFLFLAGDFLDLEIDGAITPESLFIYYRNVYVPAYADLVGYIGAKPEQVLNELENTLAHISQYYNSDLKPEDRISNLKKAHSHLTRATLDCYKLLWWTIHNELETFYKDVDACAFILNVPEEKFIQEYQEFREKAQIARKKELESIGIESLEAVELYKEAIILGKRLTNCIDGSNRERFYRYRRIVETKKCIFSFILGIITGVLGNYIWSLL